MVRRRRERETGRERDRVRDGGEIREKERDRARENMMCGEREDCGREEGRRRVYDRSLFLVVSRAGQKMGLENRTESYDIT